MYKIINGTAQQMEDALNGAITFGLFPNTSVKTVVVPNAITITFTTPSAATVTIPAGTHNFTDLLGFFTAGLSGASNIEYFGRSAGSSGDQVIMRGVVVRSKTTTALAYTIACASDPKAVIGQTTGSFSKAPVPVAGVLQFNPIDATGQYCILLNI